jgi:hypothetical protein
MITDFCVTDTLHLYALVAILNLCLYVLVGLDFDSFLSRATFSLNLALFLRTSLETALDSRFWPDDLVTNLWIVACFAAFFYIMSPNMWGTLFLALGLLSVQAFWEPVERQILSFLSHSLDIIIDITQTKAIYASVVLLILAVAVFSMLFAFSCIQVASMSFVFSVQTVTAIKLLSQGPHGRLCCNAEATIQECPYWFNATHWVAIAALFVFRVLLRRGWKGKNKKAQGCYKAGKKKRSVAYKVVEVEEEGENAVIQMNERRAGLVRGRNKFKRQPSIYL